MVRQLGALYHEEVAAPSGRRRFPAPLPLPPGLLPLRGPLLVQRLPRRLGVLGKEGLGHFVQVTFQGHVRDDVIDVRSADGTVGALLVPLLDAEVAERVTACDDGAVCF